MTRKKKVDRPASEPVKVNPQPIISELEKKKHAGGRPSKLDQKMIDRCAMLWARGMTDKEVAFIVGIQESTINNWKKDLELMEALKVAKELADSKVEQSLYFRACGYSHAEEKVFQYEGGVVTHMTTKHYPPDTVACIYWLKNRKPQEWRERIEAGTDGLAQLTNSIVALAKENAKLERQLVEGGEDPYEVLFGKGARGRHVAKR